MPSVLVPGYCIDRLYLLPLKIGSTRALLIKDAYHTLFYAALITSFVVPNARLIFSVVTALFILST